MRRSVSLLVCMFFVVTVSNVYGGESKKADSSKNEDSSKKADSSEEVLFEENFDDLEEGEESGWKAYTGEGDSTTMTVQKEIAQGKQALRVDPGESEYKPYNEFGIEKEINIINDDAKISFSYYQQGLSGGYIQAKDVTMNENCSFGLPNLVEGKWTKVIAKYSRFKPNTPKGSIKKGDEFRNVGFFFHLTDGKPRKDQFFILDDIKITVKK